MIKAYIRIFLVIVWLFIIYSIRLLALPLMLVSRPLEARCRQWIFRTFARGTLFIVGMKVEVEGPIPARPYVLVSNHLSAFDIFVLASVLGPIFVSHGEVAHWPIAGLITRSMSTIFIDRARLRETVRVNKLIGDMLDRNEGIVFFPESTTTEDGNLLPFKTALFEPPVQLKRPVHYASLSYQTPEGSPSAFDVCVWRAPVTFLGHFANVAALPSSRAIVVFGEQPICGADRKELAEELRDAIAKNCRPLE